MKWKNVVMFLMFVAISMTSARAGIPLAPTLTPPSPGGGEGGGGGLPAGWNMNSGSSRWDDSSSAWGGIGGETMGIPESVNSYINWQYQEPRKDGGGVGGPGNGNLFFTINFSTAGNVEKPTEAVNLGTGGHVNINSTTIQKIDNGQGEEWYVIQFNRELTIDWGGGYSSWVGDGHSGGSFSGSASLTPIGILTAIPQIDFNHWDDPNEPRPEWFKDYNAGVQTFGFIPASEFSVTVVPEPATMALTALGGIATLRLRRGKHRVRNLIA